MSASCCSSLLKPLVPDGSKPGPKWWSKDLISPIFTPCSHRTNPSNSSRSRAKEARTAINYFNDQTGYSQQKQRPVILISFFVRSTIIIIPNHATHNNKTKQGVIFTMPNSTCPQYYFTVCVCFISIYKLFRIWVEQDSTLFRSPVEFQFNVIEFVSHFL